MSKNPSLGILISNTGTPAKPTAKEIKKFLGRFLIDKRIAPMNRVLWWMILHGRILPLRTRRNEARYQSIWTDEGNPFTLIHNALLKKLSGACEDAHVVCGMSYSDPDIYAGLRQLKDAGCEEVTVLPLYPQSAYSTTGAVSDGVERALKKLKWNPKLQIIDNYHNNPRYIKAIADTIREAGFDPHSDDRIMFSFHSIPMTDIDAGDTYDKQTKTTCALVADELGIDRERCAIGYQCRFDRGREWLKPYATDVLSDLACETPNRLFFICPNFAVDCLETLYDIDQEIKPHYEQAIAAQGKKLTDDNFIYVPCLNSSDTHVEVLKDILKK